jgi:alkanesulfonate monooxygenase SsuD/methylene tetrahydromethanopterin reductase-like flavin-dependent oxidoreductase (luciferase family)
MSHPVKFGVTLPQIKRTWAEARAAAVEFESLGYDSLWVCDHLYGVPAPTIPILEAWSELAAVAAVTERCQLGSLVTPPLFRNAGVWAKQLATIDHIAGGGRVIAGLGAGWFQEEFEGYGCPFPADRDRLAALDEACQVLKLCWSGEPASFEGSWFNLDKVVCEPRPDPPIPILIGGAGERVLMGIAARHADIWNNLATHQGDLAHKVLALRRRCEEVGRDPDSIEVSQQCTVVITETEAEAREALGKAAKVYGGHMGAGLEAHGIWGHPEQVIDGVNRHIDAGCTTFVIEFFGRDTRLPAKLFAEHVIPAFR